MRYLSIDGELSRAIAAGQPAIALPTDAPPDLLLAAAKAVRAKGCADAPVSVLAGRLCLGAPDLPDDPRLTRSRAADCGSLPVFLAEGGAARAALSCAIPAASMAGIPLLAAPSVGEAPLGGLPARGMPADLRMLTRTPTAVVCAGVAPPFEPAACLAGLRRRGVPLIGFCGFWEGFADAADLVTDDPTKIARVLHSKWSLGLPGGALILFCGTSDPRDRFADCAGAAAAVAIAYAALA